MLVCLSCWEVFEKDIMNPTYAGQMWCPKKSCGGVVVVDIDECLIPVIKLLNQKGYFTEYCCSGHFWDSNPESGFYGGAYISFDECVQLEDIINLPAGFTAEVIESKKVVVIRKKYEPADLADLHIAILKAAIDLTAWAEGLAERSED